MTDQSHLDSKYFIDRNVYNCPFCNRRHVSYHVYDQQQFDWNENKACSVFFVRCDSCEKRSMHLTFEPGLVARHRFDRRYIFDATERDILADLDSCFFYSVPSSFFVLDDRIPRQLRDLLAEAQGCLKSNFLTGASACARKIVYELASMYEAEGSDYESRIRSLKLLHPGVEPEFFDTLITIQQITSSKVHENSYDGWQANHLRAILLSLYEVLHEIFVVPELRKDRRTQVLSLRESLLPKRSEPG